MTEEVTKSQRDRHDVKELAFMLNGLETLASRLQMMSETIGVIAEDILNKKMMIQTRMGSIADDIIGIDNKEREG